MMFDGYGAAWIPWNVSIGVVLRNWLAVSFTITFVVPWAPTPPPVTAVSVNCLVSSISYSVSGQFVTLKAVSYTHLDVYKRQP